MDKVLNNFYIKTLLRILKDNKTYEYFRKENNHIITLIKDKEEPYLPHVLVDKIILRYPFSRRKIKEEYCKKILPYLVDDIYEMLKKESTRNVNITKEEILLHIKSEHLYSYCSRFIEGGRTKIAKLKFKYIYNNEKVYQ
jgi:hypothetical protein